jgi:hypothetical protein
MQEKKHQSRQWLEKGTQGPIKAKVIASCIKHMVLTFFDNKGMVSTNHVPRGVALNTDYISALKKFIKALHQKRLDLDLMFLWDKTLVHTAQKVQQFLAKKTDSVASPSLSLPGPCRHFPVPLAEEGASRPDIVLGQVQN